MKRFAGKNILVGVTGSIAAFKVAGWVSTMAKAEACVSVVMTEAACRFVAPLTFAALSGHPVHTDMFDDAAGESMAHIRLGSEADLIVIAPASAHTIAQLACGMAGNLLTAVVLAARAPVVICPAMNTRMYEHPATQENLLKLRTLGYYVLEPGKGLLACKEEGAGRLAEWDDVWPTLLRCVTKNDLAGKKIVVTAGPTREAIDPARFLSNRSSGKMGYALAQAAQIRGAEVVLVSGPTMLPTPPGLATIRVQSAAEMYEAVLQEADTADVIIKAAAVADYKPVEVSVEKMKKENISAHLQLAPTQDILFELGKRKKAGQILVGFAAESSNLEAEGQRKLKRKNLDLIAVNNIQSTTTGFEVDTNQLLLIDESGSCQLPLRSKSETADLLLDRIVAIIADKGSLS